MSTFPPPWPIQSELPQELTSLANHISQYFTSDPPYNNASLGALIFTPPPQPPTLLMIQVSAVTDPHTFSCTWEVPSGRPSASDLTLLLALSRVIQKQSGLHLSQVNTMSGSEVGLGTFESGNAQWMKLQFTVQVSELDADPFAFSSQQDTAHQADLPEDGVFNAAKGKGKDPSAVSISLNQELHQRHAWVTEDDLREFINSGLYPQDETRQYQSMLDAFALYRQVAAQEISNATQKSATIKASASSSESTSSAPSRNPSTRGVTSKVVTPTKSSPAKKASKSDKARPDASRFHRFRIN